MGEAKGPEGAVAPYMDGYQKWQVAERVKKLKSGDSDLLSC